MIKDALEAMTLAIRTAADSRFPDGRLLVRPVLPRDIHTHVLQTMAWKVRPRMWRIMK